MSRAGGMAVAELIIGTACLGARRRRGAGTVEEFGFSVSRPGGEALLSPDQLGTQPVGRSALQKVEPPL